MSRNLAAPVRFVALVVGAVAFGLVCGRVAASHYGIDLIAILVGIPLLVVIGRRPFLAVLCVLAVLASVTTYAALPRVPLPGHPPINFGDVAVAAAVGGTLWRRPWQHWPAPARRFALALLAVIALASISSIRIALESAAQAREVMLGYKLLFYLAVALTIGLELSGKQWWSVLNVMTGFAALISILSIAGFASGAVRHFLLSLNGTSATTASQSLASGGSSTVGATGFRIRLPGLYFVYAMAIPTLVLALALRDRWRLWRFVAVAFMLAAIGISLNRDMYIGAVVGLLVTGMLGGRLLRHRVVFAVSATVLTVLVFVLSSVVPAVSRQVATRAGSVLSPAAVSSSRSVQGRALEFSYGLQSIAAHPLDGIGWFQGYGYYIGGQPQIGVENLYLDLALDYGIPAALVWMLIPGGLLVFGVKSAFAARRSVDRALVAGLVGSLVAVLLSLLVGSYLQDQASDVGFAVLCGLLLAAGLRAIAFDPPVSTPPGQPRPST